jgi:hypothetical protein
MPVDRLTGGRVGEFHNQGAPTLPEWATDVPSRNPQFKIHRTQGLAMSALSDKMPYGACQVLRFDLASMMWKVYIDFISPTDCERCGGPFAYGTYRDRTDKIAEDRLGDKRPKWQRDIICRVCWTADRIDNYLENKTYDSLPYGIGGSLALTRLIEVAPVFKHKWNECIELHHEYKKRKGRI